MSLRVMAAAAKVQWNTSRRAPEHMSILITAPVMSVIFLSIVRYNDRDDLVANAVIGTGLFGIWFVAVDVAGGVIQNERWMSTLDLVLAAPRAFALVVCGRILPVMLIGAFTLMESWLVATAGFGAHLSVRHPGIALAALIVTLLATACTATMLATFFVISRDTTIYQNALSYPFYILGGVVFPLSVLPDWIQPVGRVVFLSWSADLLRDSLSGDEVHDVVPRLGAVAGLGAVALLLGIVLIRKAADRARRTGMVSLA
ncbi:MULTISPECIES: ABC transporter permease [Streptomyces]|uniref:ABC transporter permease n=1 Tax=Streptomyces yunnanensis TaxID=156453 RepID=A0ABY8A264_9ACTN|nr:MULTISPECIES: ABC transporter permease [Streptomyces]WEB37901.1 ABC transporter permease [Streptomyces yunnanensis]